MIYNLIQYFFQVYLNYYCMEGGGGGVGEGRIHKHSLLVAVPTQHITRLYISLKNMTTLTEEVHEIKIHHCRRQWNAVITYSWELLVPSGWEIK
jgi:hypothetical protein